jgi:hypothetical protein
LQAGFRGSSMITSRNGLLYSYAMFLIGQRDFGIDHHELRNIISRWFFMTSLSGRYTGTPEGVMESDLIKLRNSKDAKAFIETLDGIIKNTLTEDFWNITLPNDLATSAARSPSLFAYYASLNILDARVLFSKIKVAELLDPALRSTKSAIERHHLFPKKYLEKIGITETKDVNQIANFALVEWPDNIDISNLSPTEYFPKYASHMSDEMRYWYGLPHGWEHMKYSDFLAIRRKSIARVIHDGFNQLSNISASPQLEEYVDLTLEELIKKGESNTIEFKSSMRWDYNANKKGTDMGQLAILKTIAAFMNSEGGTLIVGVDDNGSILGIEKDYETFSDRKNWDGWSQHLVNILRKHIGTEFMSRIKLDSMIYLGKTVAKIKVQKSYRPVFVEYQDSKSGSPKTEFYYRAINTTQALNTKQASDYIKEHW